MKLETDTPSFWFMMQIAMLCGFATSYPVNWWLLRSGIKKKMSAWTVPLGAAQKRGRAARPAA